MGSGNIKKFELKLGRTGLIILIAGMTILLCLTFILGVTVGSNMDTYPAKISSVPQRFLALFWRPANFVSQQSVTEIKKMPSDQGHQGVISDNRLTDRKLPSLSEMPSVEKRNDDAAAKDQTTNPPVIQMDEPSRREAVSKKEEASEKKAQINEKPTSESKTKQKEVPKAAVPAESSFIIHVASVKDKSKANQINKTVAGLGYPSKVVKTDIPGKGTWYRVLSTGFSSKAQAEAAVIKISKDVKTKCIIRPAGSDADKNH